MKIHVVLLFTLVLLVFQGCANSFGTKGVEQHVAESVIEVLQKSQRVLWIGAHPDDENSSGGLIARAKDLSGTLFMATLTRGENSDIVWNGLCRGSQIGQARAVLFAQSAAIFRADGYDIGPFVNGPRSLQELDRQCPPGAPFQPWPPTARSDDVIKKWEKDWGKGDPVAYVVALLRRRRPNTVIAMDDYCGVSGHPEHIAVARLLLRAIPLAASPGAYPETGKPWRVEHVIFSAHVIQPVVASNYSKCEGSPPREPIEEVPTLETSRTHGMTYFRVACLVAKTYQNTMLQQGATESQIQAECARAERDAIDAYQRGVRSYPIVEPYRIRSFN